MNLWVIFLTGLTTGGLACLAVQGGLLTSVIANQKEQELEDIASSKDKEKQKKRQKYLKKLQGSSFAARSFDQLDWMPVGMFLLTKFIVHVLAGFLLGWLGSTISLSLGVRLLFQILTALFMFATAMNLLDVHPVFRIVAFQPPKFLQKMIRNTSKSKALFAPALLGAMTIFIPCGVTQAMEVLAINVGSPIQGALIMGAFVLGTSPLFALVGVTTAKLSEAWHQKFTKIAAAILIAMAVYSANGVLVVMDSPITVQRMVRPITYFFSEDRFATSQVVPTVSGQQQVTIDITNYGYEPDYVQVKAGTPVTLTLRSNETYSCALAFVLREFGINTFLDATDTQSFTFTPQKKGRFTYTCSMGMYSGVLEVI